MDNESLQVNTLLKQMDQVVMFTVLRDLDESDNVRKVEKRFEEQISDLSATIHRIQVFELLLNIAPQI